MKFQILSVLALVGLVSSAFADPRETLTANLAFMKSVYEAQYAPKDWKRKFSNWDLNQSFTEASQMAGTLQTDGATLDPVAAREVIKKFIYSMKDYHVSVSFYATEASSLPFTVKGAEDKVFIAYIDRSKLPASSFPFSVGDEVISFAGKPIAEAIKEVQLEKTENVALTDRALAEIALTSRKAARGYKVPKGTVMVSLKQKGSEAVKSVELYWDYTPEKVTAFPKHKKFVSSVMDLANLQMSADMADLDEPNPFTTGQKKSYLPTLGQKIWQADENNTFDAYMAMNEQRKIIGVVRIFSYSLSSPEAYVKAVQDFRKIISLFQVTTDAMVIDQINNPGGSVFYLYQLASMLTDQPLQTPRHRMSLTQKDIIDAVDSLKQLEEVTDNESAKKVLGDNWSGFPMNYQIAQFAKGYYQFRLDEWAKGKKLTDPYYIGGANFLNPSSVRYTKPLLIVVNELCFSGGDFFPAIMQDNKRATIMGVRTAGAGGYVMSYEYPNAIGVQAFRVTGSIAERADLNPIENLGIEPDLSYALKASDLQNGFSDYKAAVKSAVESLIK